MKTPAMHPTGFTLIELMIVVAVAALLASLALPSYQAYVQRAHRAHAQTALVQAAQWMERAAVARGSFPLTNQIPADLLQVEGQRYNVVADSNGTTYTLTATPLGGQAGDPCAALRIDQTGRRSLTSAGAVQPTLSIEACWEH